MRNLSSEALFDKICRVCTGFILHDYMRETVQKERERERERERDRETERERGGSEEHERKNQMWKGKEANR